MKKILFVLALGGYSVLSADSYYGGGDYGSWGSCPGGNCPYNRGQSYPNSNYNQGYYQNSPNSPAYPNSSNYNQGNYRNQPYQNQPYYSNYPQSGYSSGGYQNPRYAQPVNSNEQYDQRSDSERNEGYQDSRNDQQSESRGVKFISDQELHKKIRDALSSGWFSKGYETVTFEVYNGNVTLKGSVETPDDKSKVEDAIKKTDGVNQVNNQINVTGKKTSYTQPMYSNAQQGQRSDSERSMRYGAQNRSDEDDREAMDDSRNDIKPTKFISDQELNKNIREALGPGWFSKGYDTVSFDVYNGNVTLKGTLETPEDRSKVEDIVKRIDGVRQVNDQINVTGRKAAYMSKEISESATKIKENENKYPQDKAATDGDRLINSKIRDKLNGGWFSKGYLNLVLRTSNGVVYVSGVVDNFDDIQKISKEIQGIEGVKTVNNTVTSKNK